MRSNDTGDGVRATRSSALSDAVVFEVAVLLPELPVLLAPPAAEAPEGAEEFPTATSCEPEEVVMNAVVAMSATAAAPASSDRTRIDRWNRLWGLFVLRAA